MSAKKISISDYDGSIEELIATLNAGIRTTDFCISDGSITIMFEKKEKSGAKPLLSADEKKEIQKLYLEKVYTQAELAKKYNVARTTIGRIVRGK